MTHIKISKGLDIPIKGKPAPGLFDMENQENDPSFNHIALNLESFFLKFHLLAKPGDRVKAGEPIAEDKQSPARKFVAPASGVITEIQRGLKRSLTNILIKKDPQEDFFVFPQFDWKNSSRQALLDRMAEGGLFSKIRMRPFDLPALPHLTPRDIFIKAVESAPFCPPAELQVQGHEKNFQTGLEALTRLTDGNVHLIYRKDSPCRAFSSAKHVTLHTIEGPHPSGNASVHIQHIAPITTSSDVIWTLNTHDVISLGHLLNEHKVFLERVVSIAGPGILPERTGYFRLREGFPIARLIANRIEKGKVRLISGDPLNGTAVEETGYLGFNDYAFTVIPENIHREFLHFFRLGINKYSFSRAYLSGYLNNKNRDYEFTTSLHGEHRPFIDSSLIDQVQPLNISTMLLVKSVIAEDFETAEMLGLLEVAPEDFALPSFVCPSKVEMVSIMRKGLKRYADDLLT